MKEGNLCLLYESSHSITIYFNKLSFELPNYVHTYICLIHLTPNERLKTQTRSTNERS